MAKNIKMINGKVYINGVLQDEENAKKVLRKDNKITGGIINFGTMTINGKEVKKGYSE